MSSLIGKTMKLYRHFMLVAALLTLPACEQKPNINQTNGLRDAIDARPQEGLRDAGEQVGEAVMDAARDFKNAVK
jgi:hypothetical protein